MYCSAVTVPKCSEADVIFYRFDDLGLLFNHNPLFKFKINYPYQWFIS